MAKDGPVTQEEAKRIQNAKAMLYPDAAPPSQDMLSEAAADQDAAAAGAPARPGSPGADVALDAIVQKYTSGAAPAVPSPEAPAPKADPYALGAWTNAAAAHPPEFNAGVQSQTAAADSEAAKRAEFNRLNPRRAREADARLAQQSQPGIAIVTPGGMRPSSDTVQVTQGPEVSDAQRLLQSLETNAVGAARGDTEAAKQRDTVLAGLESEHGQNTAKLAGGEQHAAQAQSAALSHVADRMSQALDAARVPVVSPAQDLNNMGMGQKLAFMLAAAGGGVAGRATGQNPFLGGYNQMVDARIATQKAQAEQAKGDAAGQENLYSVMKQGFQSDDAARAAMRTMYLQALDTKLKEAALHYNIDAANPHLQQLQAGIAQQLLTNQMELAKISGKHVSEESTSKYVPPSVTVVGGAPKNEGETRKQLDKYWTEHKLYDKEADLDTLNNIVRQADKGGVVMKYIAAHPGMSYANAFFAARNDPTQKQLMVDIEREVKDNIAGNGMRSELGRQLGQTLANAENAQQAYSRLNSGFANEAASGIAAYGGIDAYKRWRQEAEDIQNSTNSPVQAQGSDELPRALPPVDGAVAPAVKPPPITQASHHKKRQ